MITHAALGEVVELLIVYHPMLEYLWSDVPKEIAPLGTSNAVSERDSPAKERYESVAGSPLYHQ